MARSIMILFAAVAIFAVVLALGACSSGVPQPPTAEETLFETEIMEHCGPIAESVRSRPCNAYIVNDSGAIGFVSWYDKYFHHARSVWRDVDGIYTGNVVFLAGDYHPARHRIVGPIDAEYVTINQRFLAQN